MKRCDICGYQNNDNQMFCQQCGNKLVNSPQNNQYQQQQYQQQQYQQQNYNPYNQQQNVNPQYNNAQGTYYQPPGNNYPQQQVPVIIEKKKSNGCLVTLAVFGGIFLFIIFIALVGSCGTSSSSTNTSSTTTTNIEETTEITTEKDVYDLGNGTEIKFKSSQIVKEEYGDKYVLVLNFDYTNNSDAGKTFDYDATIRAFQSGVELQKPFSTYGIPNYDFHNTEKEIKPGVTLEIQEAFYLDDTNNTVSVEVFNTMIVMSDEPDYTFEIELE